ncbi:MAG: hypothetical protein RBS73_06440 [Prolixibacteraceae bacterium]|jgi:hypothetical protein|nr:hypothetical protein [Prolixibacteraceae bacterium]
MTAWVQRVPIGAGYPEAISFMNTKDSNQSVFSGYTGLEISRIPQHATGKYESTNTGISGKETQGLEGAVLTNELVNRFEYAVDKLIKTPLKSYTEIVTVAKKLAELEEIKRQSKLG